MSLSTTYPTEAVRDQRTETRALLLIIWGATVISYLLTSLRAGETLSTDDAMRLVEVQDFLAGQGWFDLTQYRLSPPGGVAMHWSRLIDLPLAALIRAGELLAPAALAERAATIVWPVALLLVFLAGVVRLARELAGDAAARLALVFAALLAPVMQHFRPGAIDHHNVQLALLVWSVALAMRPQARDAAVAGILCALSLAIGQEMAPAIAALAGAIALRWIVLGAETKSSTVAFALSFAGATLMFFAAAVAPADYAVPACDALSIVQVAAAVLGGGGLALLAGLPGVNSRLRRLASAAALGAILAAMLVLAFPACLGDPYAQLDPRLSEVWLANVSEARSILSLWRDLPQEVPAYYGLIAAGLGLALVQVLREPAERRWPWIESFAVLASLAAVALWEMRGTAAANALSAALVPAALVRIFPAPDGRAIFFGIGRAVLVAAAFLNPLALIGIGAAAARTIEIAAGTQRPTVIADGPGTCRRAADYAPLARLPRGLVLAFIDAGPFILMETPHSVLAAPYHRNLAGNAAMLDVLLAAPDDAGARLAALGIDYVAFCPGAPERYNYIRSAPGGLAAALARGETPAFLERIALDGTDLAVYRRRR
jgi:hypothetical protein